MSKLLLCTVFLSSFIWKEADYAQIFGADYQQAINFCKAQKTTIATVSQKYKVPTHMVISIVFPELIRYSTFKNFFESTALEYAYTKGGSRLADFSISRFQMKPSFAEKLEVSLSLDPILKTKYASIVSYSSQNLETQRIERVERLGDLRGQMTYLCGFYDLMQAKIEKITSTQEKIKYLATAYNCGFDKEEKIIYQWMQRKTFPYGVKYPESHQYNYAAIAVDFYKNHTQKLF